jgi:SAM-dependent methyltransferase
MLIVIRVDKADRWIRMSKIIKECIVCGKELYPLLDLGNQPLANSYTNVQCQIQDTYPLCLCRCKGCFHLQINCIIDPSILFENYIYISGTSQTGKNYFESFAKHVYNSLDKGKSNSVPCKVLDIACNDGSQLDCFKKLGCITVGVDPAKNLKDLVVSKGHDMYSSFFTSVVTDLMIEEYSSFDIILAQNVFAHVEAPYKFLKQCSMLMHDDTRLYIQTSQAKMIQNNEFDTVYHEHISFFNTNSMRTLCERAGLYLNNVTFENIHGTSYLFEISKVNKPGVYVSDSELYNESVYSEYTVKCNDFKNRFKNTLDKYKSQGYSIIGYGSTAKSNTMLNYCGIGKDTIDYIIDENSLKYDKYTPGGSIPIVSLDWFRYAYFGGGREDDKVLIVVLAWNYIDEIVKKIKNTGIRVEILNINPLMLVN